MRRSGGVGRVAYLAERPSRDVLVKGRSCLEAAGRGDVADGARPRWLGSPPAQPANPSPLGAPPAHE